MSDETRGNSTGKGGAIPIDTEPIMVTDTGPEMVLPSSKIEAAPPIGSLALPDRPGAAAGAEAHAALTCGCCDSLLAESFTSADGRLFYACPRCGAIQTATADIRTAFTARISALAPGESLTVERPFRSMRALEVMREVAIDGGYLLERTGAQLLMRSLGMKFEKHSPETGSMTFTKE